MPNWSSNTIVIKGSKDQVKNFIVKGLENSNVAVPETNDVHELFNLLLEEGKHKSVKEHNFEKVKRTVIFEKGVTLRTFLPMPNTFLEWDTTNNKDGEFAEIAKQQVEEYGCSGWYDYNCMTLGCKWDSEMDNLTLEDINGEESLIKFNCETPWSMPTGWGVKMAQMFPELSFYILAFEESNAYALYGKFTENDLVVEVDRADEIDSLFPEYNEDDEDYDDKVEEATNRQMEIGDEMYFDFNDYIYKN